MSVIIFILVLSILIIVHELGHFTMAKSLGIKVDRFAIGFGPKLVSKNANDTEFAVCAVPLGGYVKMAGDERSECKGLEDEYYSRPPGHRAIVVALGPVVNYLLAYLCFCFVFFAGYPTLAPKVGELIDDYPAVSAGIKVGDEILEVNSKKIKSWEDMQKEITSSTKSTLNLTILRDGAVIGKLISPKEEKLENIFGQKETVRLIGIRPGEDIIILKYGFFESFGMAAKRLFEITAMTYKAIYRMITGGMSARKSLTGPIGIFYIIKKALAMGFSYFMYILAVISASLAIFNFLPFPVLDGGHLLLLGIERVRGKPISPKTDEVINKIGLSLIICLAVFVFYNDFMRFGLFDKIITFFKGIGS